jgi:hypothetical protein
MLYRLHALAVSVSIVALAACGTGNPDDPGDAAARDDAAIDASGGDADPDAGSADADPGVAPATPTVRAPWSGFQTGSLWTDGAAGVTASPLRPTFRWSASAGATSYRLELDDSCTAVASCDFPSPELDVMTTAPTFTPATALAVSRTVPVGRRYHFRVRACNDAGCSAPTAVHYVDVGRVDGDLDGDGYPELLLTSNSLKTYVYRGTSTGVDPTPVRTLRVHQSVGAALAGDLDGDGFGDVVIGNQLASANGHRDVGEAYVYRGSATGLSATPTQTIASPISTGSFVMFGLGARGIRDVNGDGYADVVIGMPLYARGLAYVFFGSPTGVELTGYLDIPNPFGDSGRSLGERSTALGDVNGDGLADFAVADSDRYVDGRWVGAVSVYAGRAPTPSTTPVRLIANPDPMRLEFGSGVGAAGDFDGDGYNDLIAMTKNAQHPLFVYPNRIFLYRGGASGPGATPDVVIESPLAETGSAFAREVAGGVDVDGDGRPELLANDYLGGADDTGRAFLFDSTAVAPRQTFVPDPPEDEAWFGAGVALCDLDSDGFGDAVIGQFRHGSPRIGAAHVYPGGPSGAATTPSQTLLEPDAAGAGFPITATCRR